LYSKSRIFLPSTACILQARLGLEKQVGAFDFNLGCSGYTYGLSMAKAFIDSKQAKNVLLVTAETYSKYLHPLDRTNRSIFGDAASATLISASKEDGLGNFVFGTDGLGADKLIVKNGASKFNFDKNPTIKEYGTGNKFTDNHLYMNGPDVFNFTLDTIPNVNEQVLEKNNIDKSVVSQFILHQANAFMLNFLRKRMKINKENFYINLEHGGNTVSSTIPIALKEYSKTITAKEIIMLLGFGVGLSWCGGVLKLNKSL
jgi:3-oxoacyl-[acyl-carrier-protein] synthase III